MRRVSRWLRRKTAEPRSTSGDPPSTVTEYGFTDITAEVAGQTTLVFLRTPLHDPPTGQSSRERRIDHNS
jgi:hypothetical protein